MIELENVSLMASDGTCLLNEASCRLNTASACVIFSGHEAERKGLIAALAGLAKPSRGNIHRHVQLSYPLGYVGAFPPNLSVAEVIRHAAYSFEKDSDELIAYVSTFPGIDIYGKACFGQLHASMQNRISFAIGYGLSFECYLFDGAIAVGDTLFRKACERAFDERCTGGMVLLTSRLSQISTYGKCGAIVRNQNIFSYDSVSNMARDARHLVGS